MQAAQDPGAAGTAVYHIANEHYAWRQILSGSTGGDTVQHKFQQIQPPMYVAYDTDRRRDKRHRGAGEFRPPAPQQIQSSAEK